jgi:type VI secretion system secreted protein VgrG
VVALHNHSQNLILQNLIKQEHVRMSAFDGTPLPEVELSLEVVDGSNSGSWRPVHLATRELISKPYEMSVVLATTHIDAQIDELYEKSVGVEILRGSLSRYVRGWVRRVEDLGTTGGYRFARVMVVPQLYKLSHRVNSRIWQNVNVIAIVREVLRDASVYQGEGGLVLGAGMDLPTREYCVQYRETDLDFVMRLLQEEGVAFYFRHATSTESLVLAGEGHAFDEVQTMDGEPIAMADGGTPTGSAETMEWFDWHRSAHSTGVVLRDFDFTHPRSMLDFTTKAPGDVGARPVYDYPGRYNLGEYNDGGNAYVSHQGARGARLRNEEIRHDQHEVNGRSNVTHMAPGSRFKLSGHIRTELDTNWLLTRVEQEAIAWGDIPDDTRSSEHMKAILRESTPDVIPSGVAMASHMETRYANQFRGIPLAVQFRPRLDVKRPIVHGAQTATVMAEPGSDDEICVDFHGRILVRFHWERPELRTPSQRGKNASCWIRVAQAWAGAAWGSIFIPRVGMEVVVTFLEGDPDRPLVTGCVYNGVNNTPYGLPEEKTKSTIKTSTTPGGDGFNELRFEDLKDREQIFVHAQRDWDSVVRRDQTLMVGNDRKKTIQGNESNTIVKDRTSEIQGTERLLVQGDRNERINGGKGYAINVVQHMSLNADASIKLTCGDSSIEMLPDKITIASKTVHVLGKSLVNINGGLVKINCSDDPGGAKADKNDVEAAKPLEMRGEKGDILSRVKDMLNAEQLSQTVANEADKLLQKAGVSDKIRDRIKNLAKGVVSELVSAIKENRKPNFSKLAEKEITALVKGGVAAVFKPLENNATVKNSKFLSGLVKEAKGVATTAATWGTLHAAGLNEGLAKDPFWTVLKKNHGASVKAFLVESGNGAAKQLVDGFVARFANHEIFTKKPELKKKLLEALHKAATNGVEQGVTKLLGALPS